MFKIFHGSLLPIGRIQYHSIGYMAVWPLVLSPSAPSTSTLHSRMYKPCTISLHAMLLEPPMSAQAGNGPCLLFALCGRLLRTSKIQLKCHLLCEGVTKVSRHLVAPYTVLFPLFCQGTFQTV